MPPLPSLMIVLFIVLAISLLGAMLAYLRDRRCFAQYRELAPDVRSLAKQLRGEIHRQEHDLLITGAYRSLPVKIRLSLAENTPGLEIRMAAPAAFRLTVSPRNGRRAYESRDLVRTPDQLFDARFETRSDQPGVAGILLGGNHSMPAIQSLCRSSQNCLQLSTGLIQFSDLAVPDLETVPLAQACLREMYKLAQELGHMPGADRVKIERPRPRRIAFRLTLALGAGVALAAIAMAAHSGEGVEAVRAGQIIPQGVWAPDAALIPRIYAWRLAEESDFAPAAGGWLRGNGEPVSGRVPGNYCGGMSTSDVAYLLIGRKGEHRVVILCQGQLVVDAVYARAGLVARVPQGIYGLIEWNGPKPEAPEGDGLLVVGEATDPKTATIVYLNGTRIISGVPVDYRALRLH